MKIQYHEQDDILYFEFSTAPIVKDVSHGWHINLGYAADGLAEMTILDAKAAGYWPIENLQELMPLVR